MTTVKLVGSEASIEFLAKDFTRHRTGIKFNVEAVRGGNFESLRDFFDNSGSVDHPSEPAAHGLYVNNQLIWSKMRWTTLDFDGWKTIDIGWA